MRDEEVSDSLYALSIPHLAWMNVFKTELATRQDLQPLVKKI